MNELVQHSVRTQKCDVTALWLLLIAAGGLVVGLALPAAERPSSWSGRIFIYPNGQVVPDDSPGDPGSATLFTSLAGIAFPRT
jgi:hypothetical protein